MPILILKKKINFATQNNYLHLINMKSGFDAANNHIGAPEVMAPEQESFRTPVINPDSLPDFKDWLILPNK